MRTRRINRKERKERKVGIGFAGAGFIPPFLYPWSVGKVLELWHE